MRAVAELGYRPDAAARLLAERRSHTIGVLLNDLRQPWFADMLDGLTPVLHVGGKHILLGDGRIDRMLDETLTWSFIDLGVDGFGSDQAFIRFVDALPRFNHVVAVVTLFFPALVERVSWRDRPRLSFDGHLPQVSPPRVGFWEDLRLVRLASSLAPLDASAVALTGQVFLETARIAKERGARV